MLTKLKIFYFLIPFFISVFSVCHKGQVKSGEYFLKAYKCIDLDCQLENLNKAIELDPNFAPAYWERSHVYFNQNKHLGKMLDFDKSTLLSSDYKEIIDSYKKVYVLYPNNIYVLDIQAHLLLIQGRDNEALELFKKEVELNPNFPQAYYGIGLFYENIQQNDKALENFKKAIDLDPNFANALHRYGSIYAHYTKDYKTGLIYLDKAVKLNPNFSSTYLAKVAIYKETGEYEKGLPDLNKYIELKADNVQAYRVRADFYYKLGKNELAELDIKKAKELESKTK